MRQTTIHEYGFQPLFRDRVDAGAKLAKRLEEYRGQDVLVLGIPRGGVPVAAEVARRLDADFDIIVARKLGAPISRELAIGAVTANGGRFLNEEIIRELRVSQSYLQTVTAEERTEARRREERFRGSHHMTRVKDRIVLIVDDGLATGATMRAAVRSVLKKHPAKLVVAVPVGAAESCASLRDEADEVICLAEPEPFYAVGLYYQQFAPTEDSDVQAILDAIYAQRRRPVTPAQPPPV